jgi:iron complex outermembrane recepter protein
MRKFELLAASAMIAFWSAPAAAQDAGRASTSLAEPGKKAQEAGDEENDAAIIVTAQRREQSLQDVPISITSYSSKELKERNIITLQDLAAYTPNMEVVQAPGGGVSIELRGISTGVGGVGVDPNVGIYIDDVYAPRGWSALVGYLDVERVEVLRGPQGTLYGRNTTGGAYKLIHRRPTDKYEAGASAQFESFDRQRYEGYLSGPLTSNGSVLFRVAGARETADEYGTNVYTNRKLRATDLWSGVATLELHPFDNFEIVARGDYAKDTGRNGAFGRLIRAGTENATATIPSGRFEYANDFIADGNRTMTKAYSVEASLHLGDYTLRSITGGRHIEIDTEYDSDSTALPIYTAVLNDQSDSFSQEVQIISPSDGKLEWIAGGYHYKEDAHDLTTTGGPYRYGPFYLYDAAAGSYLYNNGTALSILVPFDRRGVFDSSNQTRSLGGFGQGTWKFTDHFSATVGIRYTDEKRTFDGTAGNTFNARSLTGQYAYNPQAECAAYLATRPVTNPAGYSAASALATCVATANDAIANYSSLSIAGRSKQRLKFSNTSYRFALDWNPNRSTHVFASATSGFKSGGFNSYDINAAYSGTQPCSAGPCSGPPAPVLAFEPPFGAEHLWSYELGAKGDLFNRALSYSVNFFYYDWSDIQLQIYDSVERRSFITTNSSARALGLELDLWARPWRNGQVDFHGAWIDAKYKDIPQQITDTLTGVPRDWSGTKFGGTPPFKWSLGVQHTVNTAFGGLTARGEWLHRDRSAPGFTVDRILAAGNYDISNVRLTYTDPSSKITVAGYIQNLFDQDYDYYRYGSELTGVVAGVAPPRTIGVRLSAAF